MNVEQALHESKQVMSARRYEHVERVTETALQLSKRFGGDSEAIGLAAALHDYAKEFDSDFLIQIIENSVELPKDLLFYNHELLHGPAGAQLIRQRFGIERKSVLNPIRFHTTGRAGMSKEEKIVFLADYIEPGRDFPAVYHARELAENNLDAACGYVAKETIQFLMGKNQLIYPGTFQAYNELITK